MYMYKTVNSMLPVALRSRLGVLRRRLLSVLPSKSYEALYEHQARKLPPTESIGRGDYESMGRRELGVLLMEGLNPNDTLVDLGCGTGRLAVHVIPRLGEGGRYIGVDISKTMLARARVLVGQRIPSPPCSIEFRHQTTPDFRLPDKSVDMVCAFSVFTHMEHEDSYLYLRGARKIIKDGGRFIYSCLPMELAGARPIFEGQASLDRVDRWNNVRNVTTSRELMDAIARMAGWEPISWYPGDQPCIRLPDSSEMMSLGQSICVLAPA